MTLPEVMWAYVGGRPPASHEILTLGPLPDSHPVSALAPQASSSTSATVSGTVRRRPWLPTPQGLLTVTWIIASDAWSCPRETPAAPRTTPPSPRARSPAQPTCGPWP